MTGRPVNSVRFVRVRQRFHGLISTDCARWAAKNCDNVFHWNHIEQIVGFEINRDRIPGVEQDLVVFSNWNVFVAVNLHADLNNTARNGRNFRSVRQYNATTCFLTGFVLPNQDS